MIDLKPKVWRALTSVLPEEQVFYVVPEYDPKEKPCISYFEQENVPNAWGDNKIYTESVIFVVDVWGDTSSEVTPIVQRVDIELYALGFERLSAVDIPDEGRKLHKSMQYGITV